MMLVRCYTCNRVFDIDKENERKEALEHSRACHEMTRGFNACSGQGAAKISQP